MIYSDLDFSKLISKIYNSLFPAEIQDGFIKERSTEETRSYIELISNGIQSIASRVNFGLDSPQVFYSLHCSP